VGYFDYLADCIAKDTFKTAGNGDRLFYLRGSLSRPYIIPDEATERALYTRRLREFWMDQLWVVCVIFTYSFLNQLAPHVVTITQPAVFLAWLAAVGLPCWLVEHFVFRRQLRGLRRLPLRIGFRDFYIDAARRHRISTLAFRILAALAFAAVFVWILLVWGHPVIASIGIVVFGGTLGGTAAGWGYALLLKLAGVPDREPPP
jgi:hypothetical protein